MSDSEDDYMSEKVLQPCLEQDIRPGLCTSKTSKRELEIYKKRQKSQPISSKQLQANKLEEGLNTAIPCENKGFQLLQKMGFKPGQSLGKDGESGLKEPIKIDVKRNHSGLGTESKFNEIVTKKIKLIAAKKDEMLRDFKSSTRERYSEKYLQKDFIKAQKVCEEMDYRTQVIDPVEDYYWTFDTMAKRLELDDEDELKTFRCEFQENICEENLIAIIDYLRHKYLYCIYCGFAASDGDDLNQNCPGPYRIDHDE